MWIKLDDGIATHPKILAAGRFAFTVQMRALCYASQKKTDGRLDAAALPLFFYDTPEIDALHMVRYGLWEPLSDGSYQIHDYLHWNMSRHEYESMKLALSKAGKKGMKSRWKKASRDDNPPYNGVHNPPYNPDITLQSKSISISSLKNSLNPKREKRVREKRVLRAISDADHPTEKHEQYAKHLGIDVGPEWGKFKNYCLAHDKRYANFDAAFRNWLANAPQMKGGRRVV